MVRRSATNNAKPRGFPVSRKQKSPVATFHSHYNTDSCARIRSGGALVLPGFDYGARNCSQTFPIVALGEGNLKVPPPWECRGVRLSGAFCAGLNKVIVPWV